MNSMRVAMVAAEAVPFAKAGGLADVVGALPVELERLGVDVTVVIPRHRGIDLDQFGFEPFHELAGAAAYLGGERIPFEVYRGRIPKSDVRVFLISNDRFFDRPGIYVDPRTGFDYPDQAQRWIFFQHAVVTLIHSIVSDVDVVHCHDHQTGLVPAYLDRFLRRDGLLRRTGTVFTIHNLGYQGVFPRETLAQAGIAEHEFYPGGPFEFFGNLNFMKAGVVLADMVTTVSETYAREISQSNEFGYGLEGAIAQRGADVVGILNGIDVREWNPASDLFITARYSADDLGGKLENKRALLERFGFSHIDLKRPALAMISRIDAQKGFDLVVPALESILAEGVYFVMIGTGNKETERMLGEIAARHPDRCAMIFDYDNELAHRIEAGADIFLMPSRYEPCGLSQMYSMRYGTVPVVRATGGLADTVQEFDHETGAGTGFRFGRYEEDAFLWAIRRALTFWERPDIWKRIMTNGMSADFSWANSARKYMDVYRRVIERRALT